MCDKSTTIAEAAQEDLEEIIYADPSPRGWLAAADLEFQIRAKRYPNPQPKISQREVSCSVCSKMNDVGVNSCWWCGSNT